MEKFTFLGKKVAMSAFLCCFSLVGFAQEDTQTFNFDATETQEYAAFFKQPSAIEGKCNAEVMGIDINREGFSWDDMNTWKNSEGKIWLNYSDGYVETLFGVCANASAPFNGKTSSLSWTNSEGDNRWYPVLPAVKNLKGKFSLTNCKATVVHISNTQLDTVRIQMTERRQGLLYARSSQFKLQTIGYERIHWKMSSIGRLQKRILRRELPLVHRLSSGRIPRLVVQY